MFARNNFFNYYDRHMLRLNDLNENLGWHIEAAASQLELVNPKFNFTAVRDYNIFILADFLRIHEAFNFGKPFIIGFMDKTLRRKKMRGLTPLSAIGFSPEMAGGDPRMPLDLDVVIECKVFIGLLSLYYQPVLQEMLESYENGTYIPKSIWDYYSYQYHYDA